MSISRKLGYICLHPWSENNKRTDEDQGRVRELLVPKVKVESDQDNNLMFLYAHMFTFIDTHMDTRPHEHIHTKEGRRWAGVWVRGRPHAEPA